MEDPRKKAVHQKLSRTSVPYANRYGMTVQQIRKALTKEGKSSAKRDLSHMASRNKNKRPAKAVRKIVNTSVNLLEVPNVSNQFAVQYPTPDWFTCKEKAEVSIIVPCHKSASVLKDLIDKWDIDNSIKTEVLYIDDFCPMGSKESIINRWALRKHELNKPVGKIFYSSVNQGFATSCNIGGYNATGEYLIFLNADTIVTPGWIQPIIRLLRKKEVGLVGNMQIKHSGVWKDTIDSAGSEWSWETMTFEHIGRHIYNGKLLKRPFALDNAPADLFEVQEREMVTGCCVGIRKDVFLEIGGFNQNYRIGYWEDSEICMTIKEKGYKILYTPHSKIYHKGHHTGSGGHKYASHNISYFKNKWIKTGRIDPLIKAKRSEVPNVKNIIIRRTAAHGDVFVASGVCSALKDKYRGCSITFCTNIPEVLENNPYIDKVVSSANLSERSFDLYFNLDMAYEFRPNSNIMECYADVVGVNPEDCKLYISTESYPGLPDDYIVMHCDNTNWEGRNWSQHKFGVLANKLSAEGHKIVVVGRNSNHPVSGDLDLRNKTNISQLAEVIKNAKMFIGIDSFPMHVAQAVKTPGVCFFGSIKPETRLIGDSIKPVFAEGLGCLGCHHRQPVPCTSLNHCEAGVVDCINLVSVDNMMFKISEKLNEINNGSR